jgi:undecaprenyl-phosphate galactose phosphotransferase
MWTRSIALGYTSAFEINNRLQFKMFLLCKKILEVALTLLVLPFIAVIGCVIAILIKTTSAGPVFYRADRIGKNGRKIRILKFRTMYRNADDMLEEILENDPVLKKEWLSKFKLTDDPRITPLGKFLRKTSLDELPQFWNVLTGDMAIIGPRPIVENEKHYYGENFQIFSVVKPGITGLWQISGRSDLTYSDRVNLDVYYACNWSLWLDYFIFLRTIVNVFACRGAY